MSDGRENGAAREVVLVSPYGIENRGVRYICAVLRREGFIPTLVLFKRWVNNQLQQPTARETDLLVDLVKRRKPLLVGFGFGAPYLRTVTELTRRIRADAGAFVLWGGVYPTVCPEVCVEHADAVCVGEGEHMTLDLCRALAAGEDVSGIPNLWMKKDGAVVQNEPRPLMQDLDALPFPEYGMPGTCYIEDDRMLEHDPIADTAEYRIYPTRGCPYACTYCNNSIMRAIYTGKGRYYRARSVENVIGELEMARGKLPRIRRIKFDGDVFNFPKAWIAEFSEKYPARVGMPFELLTYPGELDEDDLRRLKTAGLCKVQTGIQSGSDEEVRSVYQRRSTAQSIKEFSVLTHRTGVPVVYDVIFDNPLARPEDKRGMIELLLSLERPFNIYLYSLTVFPKTALAKSLLEQGVITEDDIEGRATKSFRQFRLSLDYPRKPEDVYWICLAILSSKTFIPRAVIRKLLTAEWVKSHPWPLQVLAQVSDLVKDAIIATQMLFHGELTWFKIRQYGSFRRMISQ